MAKSLTRGMLFGWLLIGIYIAIALFFGFILATEKRVPLKFDQSIFAVCLALPIPLFFLAITAAPPNDAFRDQRLLLRFYAPLICVAATCASVWIIYSGEGNRKPLSVTSIPIILQFILASLMTALLGFGFEYLNRIRQIEFPDVKRSPASLFFFANAALLMLHPLLTLIPNLDHETYCMTILMGVGIMNLTALPALFFFCFFFWIKLRKKYQPEKS